MRNLTERDQQIAREKAEKLKNDLFWSQSNVYQRIRVEDSIESRILAAIQDAKQQGNEDTARLEALARLFTACPHTRLIVNYDEDVDEPIGWTLRTEGCETVEITGSDLRDLLDKQARFDAARGVQPAAKLPAWPTNDEIADQVVKDLGLAAQQESAPAAEQWTTGEDSSDTAVYLGKSERIIAYADSKCQAELFAKAHNCAPSPAQDNPVAASVEIDCPFCDSRTEVTYSTTGTSIECIGDQGCHALITLPCFPDEAAELIERALATASSPSEQKSSLPAETLTPQEQESQETGNV